MLPSSMKPKFAYDLIRLGSANDGGYLTEPSSLAGARTMISFGVSDDWSFDADVLRRRPMRLEAFDHTISDKKFARRAFDSLARLAFIFWKPYEAFKAAKKDVGAFLGYRRFFDGDQRRHHRVSIGYGGKPGSSNFDDVLRVYVRELPVFVKCDIEGSEYRILDQLVRHADKMTGLILEVHDVDLHRGRIERFLAEFPLTLVHVHANNYSGLDLDGDPTVLELTFARSPKPISDVVVLPHRLDAPNDPNAPEIRLRFAENDMRAFA